MPTRESGASEWIGRGPHPGVIGCFTYSDLQDVLRPLPLAGSPPPPLQARVGFRLKTAVQFALATDRVRHVGEPLAVVVAADAYVAQDALDLIDVDYEPLAVVVDAEAGLAPGAVLLHEDWGDNVGVAFEVRIGDVDRALADAPVRVRARFHVPRYAGHAARDPRSPRGACRARRGHDGLGLDSGAALASADAQRGARSAGPQAARGRSRGGRRFRHEDDHLSRGRAHSPDRGAAGPSREVDGEPSGASPERDPLPRAGARCRAGRDARRSDRRLPGPVPARSRGLQPLGDRAAVQHGRPHPRPVPDPQRR